VYRSTAISIMKVYHIVNQRGFQLDLRDDTWNGIEGWKPTYSANLDFIKAMVERKKIFGHDCTIVTTIINEQDLKSITLY
jgi:hypothetical protein